MGLLGKRMLCRAQRIPGSRDAPAVMAMAWVQDRRRGAWRLFTGNIDGLLVEWDLKALRPLSSTDSFGGAIWAIEEQPAGAKASAGESVMLRVQCFRPCLRPPPDCVVRPQAT